MKMVRVAAFAAAFFPIPLAAQTTLCPDPPPMSDIQQEISAGAEANLLTRLLSGFKLSFGVKVAESDNLSRYADAGAIRREFHFFSFACKAIMEQRDLPQAQKLRDVEKLARQMLANVRAAAPNQALSGAPSATRGQSAPDRGGTPAPDDPRPSPEIHALPVDILANDPEFLTNWRRVRDRIAPESVSLLLSLEALGSQYLREVREAVQKGDANRIGTGTSTGPTQRADATLDAMADKSRQLRTIAKLRSDLVAYLYSAFYIGVFSRDDDERLAALRDGLDACSQLGLTHQTIGLRTQRQTCEASMLMLVGNNYASIGNDQAAMQTLNRAVALAQSTGDDDLLATALSDLGQAQSRQDCATGKTSLQQGALLSEKVGRGDRAAKNRRLIENCRR